MYLSIIVYYGYYYYDIYIYLYPDNIIMITIYLYLDKIEFIWITLNYGLNVLVFLVGIT